MQNKFTDKSLKQREDAGWDMARQQLDIDMPVKKKDRKFLWIFLFGAIGVGGLFLKQYGFHRNFDTNIQPINSFESKRDTLNNLKKPSEGIDQNPVSTEPVADLKNKTENKAIHENVESRLGAQNYLQTINGFDQNTKNNSSKKKKTTTSSTEIEAHLLKNNVSEKNFDKEAISVVSSIKVKSPESTKPSNFDQVLHGKNIGNEITQANHPTDQAKINNVLSEETSEQQVYSISALPLDLNELIYNAALASKISFNNVVADESMIQLNSNKKIHFVLVPYGALLNSNYKVAGLASGIGMALSKKWNLHALLGVNDQFGNKNDLNALTISSNNAAAGSISFDTKANFNLSSNSIFIDPDKNAMTRLVNGNLYISSKDQLFYTQSTQWNATGEISISYNLLPKLFLEGGAFIQKRLSNSNSQLWVQSANTASLNSLANFTGYNLSNSISSGNFLTYGLFKAGYTLNHWMAISIGYGTQITNSAQRKSLLFDAGAISMPQAVTIQQLILPFQDTKGFWRISMRFKL